MNWYYIIGPAHTRVRVFMNGGNCGELCFRNEEFADLKAHFYAIKRDMKFCPVEFINETPQMAKDA